MTASKKNEKSSFINTRPEFSETLHGLFYDIFRQVGTPIPPHKIDIIQGLSKRIAALIQVEARLASLQDLKQLQERTYGAVKAVEAELVKLDEKVSELSKQIATLDSRTIGSMVIGSGSALPRNCPDCESIMVSDGISYKCTNGAC